MRRFAFLMVLMVVLTCCFSAWALSPTPVPSSTPTPAPEVTAAPVRGYVVVTTSTDYGFLPIPESEEYVYPLVQVTVDGEQTVNYIHVTPDGVYMEDSTCEGHDCVEQGIVTFENMADRALGNMIICLPNQVMLELYTTEDLIALLSGSSASEGSTP